MKVIKILWYSFMTLLGLLILLCGLTEITEPYSTLSTDLLGAWALAWTMFIGGLWLTINSMYTALDIMASIFED